MNYKSIQIIRSPTRRKTIQSKIKDEILFIYLPDGLSDKEEDHWINTMIDKNKKRTNQQGSKSDDFLQKRANELNKKFFESKLNFQIKYVSNQKSKFGSCTPNNKKIRISERIASMPHWVQDYVIIHELAHLIHPNHSKKFWNLVNQYKYVERAKGYLIAIGMISEND
jgi:predicted metal-dependent hydrolase